MLPKQGKLESTMKMAKSGFLQMVANGPGIYVVLPKAQLSAVAEAWKGNIGIYGVLAFRFYYSQLNYILWKEKLDLDFGTPKGKY